MEGPIAEKVNSVFLPGDTLCTSGELSSMCEGKLKLGPGLRLVDSDICAMKAGVLRFKDTPACVWIDTNQKRYIAVTNDTVIGIISTRGVDAYKVDIGTSQMANLDALGFEGATKRHKPNLEPNDLVFAKLSIANKDMEPEITCLDEGSKSNGLGPLKGGYMFSGTVGLCRKLLEMPQCRVLQLLGKHFPFEVIVGMNGRIWISSKGIIDTIAIANAVTSSEFMADEQVEFMVKQLVNSIAGFNDDDDDDDSDDDESSAAEDDGGNMEEG